MVSNATLRRIIIGGGIISLGGAGYFSYRIHDNFNKQEFYRKSLVLLKGYEPAAKLLGMPIQTRRLNLGDRQANWTDGKNARITVPLKGPRDKGTLHSWASRESVEDSWDVDKLDLEYKGNQWTFYINPNTTKVIERTVVNNNDDSDLQAATSEYSDSQLQNIKEVSYTDLIAK